MFVKMTGASAGADHEESYVPRGVVYINADAIVCFYDHNVIAGDRKIRVMETAEEINKKLIDAQRGGHQN